jgi:hypothetical protein
LPLAALQAGEDVESVRELRVEGIQARFDELLSGNRTPTQ